MSLPRRIRDPIYLVYLGASWGLYFSLLKIAVLSGISYLGIATLTTAGVCIGMLAIACLRGRWPAFSGKHHRYYLVCAALGYLVPILAELKAIEHMPASVLTLIVTVTPLATLALAWAMKADRVDARRVAGIGVGAVAIFAILLPDAHRAGDVAWRWLLLAAVVPLSYACYHNYLSRYWPEGSDSFQLACGEAIYASLLLLALASFDWQWQDLQDWNRGHTAILLMASIALVDIYIYFELIRSRGPIYCSNANYFMVISGLLWAMFFFAERPGPMMWVSTVLLVASLYLVGERRAEDTGAEKT